MIILSHNCVTFYIYQLANFFCLVTRQSERYITD